MLTLRFAATLPKSDTPEGETGDDRFHVVGDPISGWRAAVSDGASDCFLPGVWASELTTAYIEGEDSAVLPSLERPVAAWRQAAYADPLPWYAEAKRQQGAAATLLGVAFRPTGTWAARAVGDSCLFQVRANSLLAAFPLESAGDFHSLPALIRTPPVPLPPFRVANGEWRPGDDFFLMTDALAAWFLQEVETGREPWKWLTGFGILGTTGAAQAFGSRIAELRRAGRLRDDDVTLLHFHAVEAGTEHADLVADAD
jgi:hypothetical protein